MIYIVFFCNLFVRFCFNLFSFVFLCCIFIFISGVTFVTPDDCFFLLYYTFLSHKVLFYPQAFLFYLFFFLVSLFSILVSCYNRCFHFLMSFYSRLFNFLFIVLNTNFLFLFYFGRFLILIFYVNWFNLWTSCRLLKIVEGWNKKELCQSLWRTSVHTRFVTPQKTLS